MEIVAEKKTEILDLGVTDLVLKELKGRCAGLTADTPKEYKHVVTQIAVCRTLRSKVKARHGELKRPVIDRGKALDFESNRIISALVDIEDPMKEKKKAVDDEKRRIDEEKANAEKNRRVLILERIGEIANMSVGIVDLSSDDISTVIGKIKGIEAIPEFFAEFAPQAEQAKVWAIKAATEFLEKRVDQETKAADEKKRLEAEAEQNRLMTEKNARIAKVNTDKAADLEAQQAIIDKANKERQKVLDDQQAKIDKEIQNKKDAADLLERKKQLEAMQPDIEKLQVFSDETLQALFDNFPKLKSNGSVRINAIAASAILQINDLQEYINEELADIRRIDAT